MKKVIAAAAAAMFLAGSAGAAIAGGGHNDRMSARQEVKQIKHERMKMMKQHQAAPKKHMEKMKEQGMSNRR